MKKFIVISIIQILFVSLLNAQTSENPLETRAKMLEDSLKLAPENTRIMLALGTCYHHLAGQGNKDMVGKAGDVLEQLIELEPTNASAHCWYGSVLTMKARDAFLPIMKVKHVNDGVKEMDKAVELDSMNVEVRLIRARNGLALPTMFHRAEIAVQDFEFVVALKKKVPQMFSDSQFAGILLDLGRAYQKMENEEAAKENWRKVVALVPDSELAGQAKQLLGE